MVNISKSLRLVQVQVFFRHGDRTPLHHVRSNAVPEAFWTSKLTIDLPHTMYPLEARDLCSGNKFDMVDSNTLPLPFKLPGGLYTGQLIQPGQEEAYNLGKRLRATYIDQVRFISDTPKDGEIYCRCTRIMRTFKSLRCVAAGLFQNTSTREPLPVYIDKLNRELLFPNPALSKIMDKLAKEGMAECLSSVRHRNMKHRLKNMLGVKKLFDDFRPTPWDCPVYFVRDDYVARKSADFPIPPGMNELLPEIDELAVEELYWEYLGQKCDWDRNLPQVFGCMMDMVLSNMRDFGSLPKFHLYSCHDSSLMLLLYALGCFDGYWPPFAADLILELYVDSEIVGESPGEQKDLRSLVEGLWIRVIYLGKPVHLGCQWKAGCTDGNLYNAGYVPLQLLIDRWSHETTQSNNGL